MRASLGRNELSKLRLILNIRNIFFEILKNIYIRHSQAGPRVRVLRGRRAAARAAMLSGVTALMASATRAGV